MILIIGPGNLASDAVVRLFRTGDKVIIIEIEQSWLFAVPFRLPRH